MHELFVGAYESGILERILIRYFKKKATSIWFEM
jgi:hypothetical protein